MDDTTPSLFHPGERAVHARLDIADRMTWAARRMVRVEMPDYYDAFFAQLPWLFVGAVDTRGRPWASVLAGIPGFVRAPDARTIRIAARPLPGDPLAEILAVGAPLGLLGLEFPTRRRNRANGRITRIDDAGFNVRVDQNCGNCPKYIQSRDVVPAAARTPPATPRIESLSVLDDDARALVARADTCFVASHAPAGDDRPPGSDVSHRGGRAGFVRVEPSGALRVPDFAGNHLFMTLGNLVIHPYAGVLFPDFETGDLLMLTGRAEILWNPADVAGFDGAERGWRLHPEAGVWLRGAMPLACTFRDWSPATLETGHWP
ncbi:MAG: pyridoxamine 5'-phosphate oxidase family protein [Gammaproteobacteria bacterium]